jgi:hypothetical protein
MNNNSYEEAELLERECLELLSGIIAFRRIFRQLHWVNTVKVSSKLEEKDRS